jgi:hypothetical protein
MFRVESVQRGVSERQCHRTAARRTPPDRFTSDDRP